MLDKYTVYVNNIPHVVKLTPADAKRIGAEPYDEKAAPKPKNKARKPRQKKSPELQPASSETPAAAADDAPDPDDSEW